MIMKSNYFFLLPFNPCPFLGSVASFNLLFSFILLFKFSDPSPSYLSLFMSVFSSFFWWMSYSKEMMMEGKSSKIMESGIKLSMILFISSEIFFFFSFFWSYFHYLLSPSMEIGLSWPPHDILSFDFMNVPMINTLILLSSGVTVTISHYYLMNYDKFKFSFYLFSTILLGFAFSLLQCLEYSSSFFSVGDSTFGSSFFVLTGFHGIHVIIGSLFLLTSLLISIKMNSNNENMLSFEMSSWYWHFVDVVWVFLYFFLYYATS